MRSRRLWLLTAVLAALLAIPATSAARPAKPKHPTGVRHHAKPRHKHLIAVRHGHHIHWFSRTHGLPKKKLPPIKLSANVKFAHGIRDASFGPTSSPRVISTGPCTGTGAGQSSPDGTNFAQSYDDLFGDAANCVGNDGGNTELNEVFPYPGCTIVGQSVNSSSGVEATFTDGEWMVVCTVPDDNGAGGSAANDQGALPIVYQTGFPCEVTAGVGPSDDTPRVIRTSDSVEYSQTYTENDQTVTAVTTSCVGKLPSKVHISSTAVPHLVSCTQYDPKAPGKFVRGLGETITWPDGQFQETCNVPDYSHSRMCTAQQTDCTTDVSADDTSNLSVTDSADTGGTLTENVDYGTQLSCNDDLHGNYLGVDPNWYGFSYTGTGSKILVYDLFTLAFNEGNDVQFCFGATSPFQTAGGRGVSLGGTLPDGTPGFIGLLRNCEDTDGPQPCVESVGGIPGDTSGPVGTRVRVDIPASFAADPWGHV